ncbi:MAG: hypothetical protein DWQ44_06765 [Bacteroidetes bacterium]|nr:MAG: hypothetical protein DWQ39_04415 [Bacteroidota bacterium]REK34599.1 MAG: hypothetical protein DWQ44_06765 [Bacteroidota bacterium]
MFMGCNNSKQDDSSSETKQLRSHEIVTHSDTLKQVKEEPPSFQNDTISQPEKTTNKKKLKSGENYGIATRHIEFPGDANFNSKPMTQQVEIPKEILEKHPDTLSKLAIERYKTYDNFFPKSIADNFNEMKSTEHIHYPKVLTFRFELFENKNANKPYHIEEVKVIRNPNGEIYTEKY